jgi:serine/threonine-protein kinase RsbW
MTAPRPNKPAQTPASTTPAGGPPAEPPAAASLQLVHDRDAVEHFLNDVIFLLEKFTYPKAACFAVRLALHEAITNAFEHGHEKLPPETPVRVEYDISAPQASFSVEDQGPGFTPAEVRDPTLDENLEIPSGRGIMLIRAYMTDVSFNPKGNRITMIFRRPDTGPLPGFATT